MGKDAVDELAGHLGGILRVVVEGGDDGEDDAASVGCELHVAEMNAIERGFANAEDQGMALLETDVGSSLDEV